MRLTSRLQRLEGEKREVMARYETLEFQFYELQEKVQNKSVLEEDGVKLFDLKDLGTPIKHHHVTGNESMLIDGLKSGQASQVEGDFLMEEASVIQIE